MTDPHIERIRKLDADFASGAIDRATYDVQRQRTLADAAEADRAKRVAVEQAEKDAQTAKTTLSVMKGCLGIVVIVVVLIAFVFVLSISGGNQQTSPTPTRPPTALEVMEVAFKGTPSQREIKPLIDEAMRATGLPINEENYHRAASALVALGQHNNISEMTILRCMPHRTSDPRIEKHDFASVSAVCAVDVIEGRFKE
mgnify:CR=1 FL=1